MVKFLFITKFSYNNIKNASSSHILFKINCSYYYRIFILKKKINLYSKLTSTNQIAKN